MARERVRVEQPLRDEGRRSPPPNAASDAASAKTPTKTAKQHERRSCRRTGRPARCRARSTAAGARRARAARAAPARRPGRRARRSRGRSPPALALHAVGAQAAPHCVHTASDGDRGVVARQRPPAAELRDGRGARGATGAETQAAGRRRRADRRRGPWAAVGLAGGAPKGSGSAADQRLPCATAGWGDGRLAPRRRRRGSCAPRAQLGSFAAFSGGTHDAALAAGARTVNRTSLWRLRL